MFEAFALAKTGSEIGRIGKERIGSDYGSSWLFFMMGICVLISYAAVMDICF